MSKADDDSQSLQLILMYQVGQIRCCLLSAGVQPAPWLNSDQGYGIQPCDLGQNKVQKPLVRVSQREVDVEVV